MPTKWQEKYFGYRECKGCKRKITKNEANVMVVCSYKELEEWQFCNKCFKKIGGCDARK